MLDLPAIENYVAFYQCQSMTKAAERQYISRQAISKSIRNLESTLGVKTFISQKGNIAFTQEGECLYRHAVKILEDVEKAEKDLEVFRLKRVKTLSVVCTGMTQSLTYPLIREWKRRNPDMELRINVATPEEIFLGLHNGIYDLGIAYDGMTDSRIGEIILKKDTVSVLMRSEDPLAERRKLRMEDMENRVILMPVVTKNYNQDINKYVVHKKLHIQCKVSPSMDILQILPLVREGGLYMAATNLFSYFNLGDDFAVREILTDQGMPEKKIRMVFRKNELEDVQISGLVHFFRQNIKEK